MGRGINLGLDEDINRSTGFDNYSFDVDPFVVERAWTYFSNPHSVRSWSRDQRHHRHVVSNGREDDGHRHHREPVRHLTRARSEPDARGDQEDHEGHDHGGEEAAVVPEPWVDDRGAVLACQERCRRQLTQARRRRPEGRRQVHQAQVRADNAHRSPMALPEVEASTAAPRQDVTACSSVWASDPGCLGQAHPRTIPASAAALPRAPHYELKRRSRLRIYVSKRWAWFLWRQ
jgi:hypothetical protein